MVICTSGDYWLQRLTDTLALAEAAPSQRSRLAYRTLADHYRSMHEFATGQAVPEAALVGLARCGDCDAGLARAA